MKILKKTNAVRHENSPACVAFEYRQPTDALDMARIELSGRYPSEGWALNTVCDALVYVVKGEGRLLSPDHATNMASGDQVYIPFNEKYALEGNMELLFASTPRWSSEQARHEK